MKKQWIVLLLVSALILGACSAPVKNETPVETSAEIPAETPTEGPEQFPENEEYIAKVGDEYLPRNTFHTLLTLNKYLYISVYGEELFEGEDGLALQILREETLDDFIMGALIQALALERGLSPDEEMTAQMEEDVRISLENDEGLREFLLSEGAKVEDLTPYLRMQSTFVALIDSYNEEVLQSEEHREALEEMELVHARHILLDMEEEEKANNLLEELRAHPETFEEVAIEQSKDPGSASDGGDLGYFSMIDMVAEFSVAAFGAEVGEIVLTQSQYGFHIIEVLDKSTIRELEERGLGTDIARGKEGLLDYFIQKIYLEEYERAQSEHPVEYYAWEISQ